MNNVINLPLTKDALNIISNFNNKLSYLVKNNFI